MRYETLCEYYTKIEGTTKRLEMIDLLTNLFEETPTEIIDKVIYLTQGKLHPDWMGLPEIGMAERMVLDAISIAVGVTSSQVERNLLKTGDIGLTAEHATREKKQKSFLAKPLTVNDVYSKLDKIASASGPGSIGLKKRLFSGLLLSARPIEAKFLARTVTGTLRLGIADMTILDTLAKAFAGGKENRPPIEKAYNLSSDLGYVAKTLAKEGIETIERFAIEVGKPIRMMSAQRLTDPKEILEKLGGRFAAEFKYDGERLQIHKQGKTIRIFSRRLENITQQYPDVVALTRSNIKAKEAIIEGEVVAIDVDTGELRPFQELMHRRRKYGIKKAMEKYPVSLFLFDGLFVDGKDLIEEPYPKRRAELAKIVKASKRIIIADQRIVESPKGLEVFFDEAVKAGCEGLMAKSLNSDSIYQAGARGWLWIKFKREALSELADTVDLVAVGAFMGRGRRAGTYGAILLACYDPQNDIFRTVAKVGSGFSDEELSALPSKLKRFRIGHRHSRVDSRLNADVWLVPSLVLEVKGAEITSSPTHTCGFDKMRKGSGLAIRFPRFTGNWRQDKAPEDATTEDEIAQMYKMKLEKRKQS
ncbi:MAG: ATP-dependent DNA ligase [Candidatus Hodarchaeota archaeon]